MRASWIVVFALALLATTATRAGADPFGGEGGGFPGARSGYPWRADSADHWYCFDPSVAPEDHPRYQRAMASLDAQTDMFDVYTETCGRSTDIVFIENPNVIDRGMAICVRLVEDDVCDAYWVAVNPEVVAADPGTAGFDISLNKTIQHEIGHTAGLTHELDPSRPHAMTIGPVDDLGYYNFVWGLYRPHHLAHIDFAY